MFKTKLTLFIFSLCLSLGMVVIPAKAAGELMLRVDQPATPTNRRAFDLSFSSMDILSRGIIAECLMKAPGDSGFSAVGSVVSLPGTGGSGFCTVPENRISNAGNYEYQVKAAAGADTVFAAVVVYFDNNNPSAPSDYRKEKISNCDYRIYFRTGDGTGRVELYRSDNTSFNADGGTKVAGINIGSNQDGQITNSVPDCNKTYYYAVRAYNLAGNGSDLVGDREIHTVVITPTGTTSSGAIPVSGSSPVSGGLSPQVLGEGTESDSATSTPAISSVPEPGADEDQLQTETTSVFASPVTWVVILAAIGLIYWFSRKPKSSNPGL